MVRRFLSNRDGGVAIIAAAALTGGVGLAALAVDLGSVYLQSRRLQGVADLAALAAAADLDRADRAASATVEVNPVGGAVAVQVAKGRYDAQKTAAAQRFQSGATTPDAARVTLEGQADLFFGQALLGRPSIPIRRQATAARADLASFSIGTRLASIDGGVANALLTGLTGSSVSLSVMDYQALASADIELFGYLDALNTKLGVKAASYNDLLATDVKTSKALSVLSDVLSAAGQTRASAAAKVLSSATNANQSIKLSALIDAGPYARQDRVVGGAGAAVGIDAMQLANAMLMLSNGSRQVQLDLGTAIPGLADVDAWLAIGEPMNNAPFMTVTQDKSVVIRTVQTRLYVEAKLLGSGSLLGGAAQIKVPLMVELASGEAKLAALDCTARTTTLAVKPSVGSLTIGQVDTSKLSNFKQALTPTKGRIVQAPLFTVDGSSKVDLGGGTFRNVVFSSAEVKARTVKAVKTNDLVGTTVATLITGLTLDVNLLGIQLGLGKSAVLTALTPVLAAAAAPLDQVINSLTGMLGVGLGEADVRTNGMRCGAPALVA
ncbi:MULTISPECIES: pilus assembly protein TadG-related protein [unclassified Caulobacter]|uniref:pilus assembly protein TadG-related protein n=1 Tax=unclassified Caulobacter TaxID=2648921 RepID=UPI001E5FA289|nr:MULTISPECIES: pilus assembly protein TadG-related protein [unclassified Caulobacter]